MNVDKYELRSALGRFLAAQRALRQAYRKTVASHGPPALVAMPNCGASEGAGNDSVTSEEFQELKDENRRLRKSLSLLHTYSLRIQEQRDTLLMHRNKLLDAWEAVAGWMREDDRADEHPGSLESQLDDALGEFPHQKHA